MKCHYACGSAEHGIARRSFLGGVAAAGWGAMAANFGLGSLLQPVVAKELASAQKRVLCIFLSGGLSQLESWDPKPGTDTGGPFRAIPTSVPGLHISELLPYTAKQMHRLSIIRSLNIKTNDHSTGRIQMLTGRKREGITYPEIGATMAKVLTPDGSPLPGHIQITPVGSDSNSGNEAAYLGPQWASVTLADGQPPQNTTRPKAVDATADQRRNAFRLHANEYFTSRRRSADSDAYTSSFEQAERLMARREVFDVTKEPTKEQERYGTHEFGRHCLLARRLLEQGVSYVQVRHTNYDTHFENFDFHIEQLGEFDHTFATLMDDLAQRGLLETTLVVVMSEFGRTPKINERYGRDHWGTAISVALGGCGIQPGAVIGKTNANGTAVTDREVDHGHLFHTYLRAVGVDSSAKFVVGGKELPMADPAKSPITELLA
jgi:hypothetical protein